MGISDEAFALDAILNALVRRDCPQAVANEIAPLVVPFVAVRNEEVVDPRDASARLPHRVVRVIDDNGEVRMHGVRRSDPLSLDELVCEIHNRCSITERKRLALRDPRWLAFRWSQAALV